MSHAPCRECVRLGFDRIVFPEYRYILGQFGGYYSNCKWPDYGTCCRWGGQGGNGSSNNRRKPNGRRGRKGPKGPRTPKKPKALPPISDGEARSSQSNAIIIV